MMYKEALPRRYRLFLGMSGTVMCIIPVLLFLISAYQPPVIKRIEVDIPNLQAAARVSHAMHQLVSRIQHAGLELDYKEFQQRAAEVLSQSNALDAYWIRLGLDGVLHINATLRVPILLLETKGGAKFVVSSSLILMAKNPSVQEYPGLLTLQLPHTSLHWDPKKRSDFQAPPSFHLASIVSNAQSLSTFVGRHFVPQLQLQNLSWTPSLGFQLILSRRFLAEATSVSQATAGAGGISQIDFMPQDFAVQLGHKDLDKKMQHLERMLRTLNQKKMYPRKINLDYVDRATFEL